MLPQVRTKFLIKDVTFCCLFFFKHQRTKQYLQEPKKTPLSSCSDLKCDILYLHSQFSIPSKELRSSGIVYQFSQNIFISFIQFYSSYETSVSLQFHLVSDSEPTNALHPESLRQLELFWYSHLQLLGSSKNFILTLHYECLIYVV